MIRTLLQISPPFPALCLILPLALILCACAPRPDETPGVPPLVYTPAAEVPARTFTTIPTEPYPVPPPASSPAPETASAANDPVVSNQDQRIAALELSLLNMSNELAWLKSQPVNATTPWGTPSPKVVPANQRETQGAAASAPPPAPPAALATPADKAQAERIATLERNMQAIREELLQLHGQGPAPVSPWGRAAPTLIAGQAAASGTPAVQIPAATPPPVATPAPPAAPPTAQAHIPAQPQAPTPADATPAPVSAPVAAPVATHVPAPAPTPPPAPPPAPTVTLDPSQTALAHIPPPQPEAVVTPPLRRAGVQPAASFIYTIPTLPAQTPAQSSGQPPTPNQTPPSPTAAPPPPQASRPAYAPPAASLQPALAVPGVARSEQAAYQAGLSAYENRQYNEAWNAFDRYLTDYPNGRFVPNALYWQAEVRYALGDYAAAIPRFKEVIGRFPQHPKAPDALLKIVMSYNQLRDTDNTALHLRILNEDYPRSDAARRAKGLKLS